MTALGRKLEHPEPRTPTRRRSLLDRLLRLVSLVIFAVIVTAGILTWGAAASGFITFVTKGLR